MQAGTTLTRGPLPPTIYWRRRLIALVIAAVLVFVIAQLLGGGSDGKGGGPVAQQAGAAFSTSTSTDSPSDTGTPTSSGTGFVGPTAPTSRVGSTTSTTPLTLAAPTGTCTPSDITVTPSVPKAVAGSDVTINLALQTKTSAACTWQVDRNDIAVKIARKGKVLWTSQQCPSALPERSVVIRNVVPSIVTMVWNSRISTVGCRNDSGFVRPGKLFLYGTTLGGEPGHSSFALVLPGTQTVTPSATATGTATPRPTATVTVTATPKAR